MNTIKLTTWDRVTISMNIIGALQISDARTMRKAAKILDAVELTEEEKAQIEFRFDEYGARWKDDDKVESRLWDIEINDPDALVLLKEKVANPPRPFLGAQRKQVLRLYAELGIE